MNNILVLTNLYPAPDLEKENTPVVHYFTKQWNKMGYNVLVMHYPTNFPKLIMKIASLFKRQLSAVLPATIRTKPAKELEYEIDGVRVKRIPLLKYKMHSKFSPMRINYAMNKTQSYLEEKSFIPDIIVSHWANPTLEIANRLKDVYHCKCAYVSHYAPESMVYRENAEKFINNMDIIGFRSEPIKKRFFELYNYKGKTFQCYSGIPQNLIPENIPSRSFRNIKNFVFVGTLIKRKYPAEIVPAVCASMVNNQFCIKYIGRGAEDRRINKFAKINGIIDKVHLLGYIPREEVAKVLSESDVFIMISKNEAFGLVYLEAMAQGCLTIASKGEGFDGIIKDGYNGFLCEAGDIDDLTNTIKRIRSMSHEELLKISRNAYLTAKSLTDENAARMYIEEICKVM